MSNFPSDKALNSDCNTLAEELKVEGYFPVCPARNIFSNKLSEIKIVIAYERKVLNYVIIK